jgi:hypothetical protein
MPDINKNLCITTSYIKNCSPEFFVITPLSIDYSLGLLWQSPLQKIKSSHTITNYELFMQLYVKSQKTDLVAYTMPHRDHYCSAGYRSQGVLSSYGPEDEEALANLRSKGTNFSLVDLSLCSLENKLRARMSGIKRTPTLVLNDGTKIEGIGKIKEYIGTL